MSSLVPGSAIGKYTLLERVGGGGMGDVFRAVSQGAHGFEREFAIKLMNTLGDDPARRELFFAEARSLAKLQHRNIVQVFDFAVEGERPYLVMELLQGVPASKLIGIGGFPAEGACFVAAELADALATVHQQNLVHGDLSPSNVMACFDGAVKLLDFGLARTAKATHAMVGPQAGKLPYLAPELLAGSEADALTDLYAVGLVLFELVSGTKVFRGDDPTEVAGRIVRGELPPLTVASPELAALVGRCVSRDRGQRPRSAQKLARELRTLAKLYGTADLARTLRALDPSPAPLEPTGTIPSLRPVSTEPLSALATKADAPPPAPARRRRVPLVALGVAAVGVVAFGWALSRQTVVVAPVSHVEPVPPPVEPAPVAIPVEPRPEPVALAPAPVVEPPPAAPPRKHRGPVRKADAKKPAHAPDRLPPGFIAEP